MDHNFTNKKKTFLGLNRSLFSLNKLRGLFAFISKRLNPQRTFVINNITISSNKVSKDIVDEMFKEFQRGFEEASQRNRGI